MIKPFYIVSVHIRVLGNVCVSALNYRCTYKPYVRGLYHTPVVSVDCSETVMETFVLYTVPCVTLYGDLTFRLFVSLLLHLYPHARTNIHTHTHTHAHAHTHTHTYTYIHTYTQVHTGLLLPCDVEIAIAAAVNRRSGLFTMKVSINVPKIRCICDPRQIEGQLFYLFFLPLSYFCYSPSTSFLSSIYLFFYLCFTSLLLSSTFLESFLYLSVSDTYFLFSSC